MDFLTHLFLPLTAVYVLRREWFVTPLHLAVAPFGLLSDFDKFLGTPGLLHSLLTLLPLSVGAVAVERFASERLSVTPVILALVWSHLLLDLLDGGPVPLLYPLVESGIGLTYPARTVFGTGALGVAFDGLLVAIRTTAPKPGFNTYGFVRGFGVASMLLFLVVYAGLSER
jgi:membrane-bound metal-dependent hydrolase YbcI (DUF457 family)